MAPGTERRDALRYLKNNAIVITNLKIQSVKGNANAKYVAEVNLRGTGKGEEEIMTHIAQMPGIVSAAIL